jgi:uncharacterized DUF497 family protein
MKFEFSAEKNNLLLQERGVTFERVIDVIFEQGILADFHHPHQERYPNQRIFVVELEGYTYCVPYVTDGEKIFLKTIFPSRKFMHLLEEK